MAKFKDLDELYSSLSKEAKDFYNLLFKSIKQIELPIKSKLFAGQLAFYLEETLKKTFHSSPVVVIAFYADHANIFASKNEFFQHKFIGSSLTKNLTIQIKYVSNINPDDLSNLIKESLY